MYQPAFHDNRLGLAVSVVQLIARKHDLGQEMDALIDGGEWSSRWGDARLLEDLNQFLVPAGYRGYQDFWNTVEVRTSPKWVRNNMPDVEDVYHEDDYFFDRVHGKMVNV